MSTSSTVTPNHHAHFGGFHGFMGVVAGLSFLVGRDDVATLAAEHAAIAPGDRLVDIGCGPGTAVRVAMRRGATAVGVDPAPVMLRLARLTTRRRDVRWLGGAAEALPIDDESVTLAWSLSTVHHWRDLDRGLAEVRRVLEPGGRFLVTERRVGHGAHGHGGHGWTAEQADAFATLCARAGFVDVDVSTHTPGNRPTFVVLAKRA